MLVLSRKEGQRIQIGNDTTITITKIKGNVVRIGIEAPNQVSVFRAELLKEEAPPVNRCADALGYLASPALVAANSN